MAVADLKEEQVFTPLEIGHMITTLKQKSIREKEINEHHINEIFEKARATLK